MKKVLIVLLGSVGDVARGLSLVPILKDAGYSVYWLVEPPSRELVSLVPEIEKVFTFERSKGLAAVFGLLPQIRNQKFDLVLDLQRHLKSGLFSRMSGAPRRIGFHRKNSKEFNWIFNNEKIDFAAGDLPKIEHYWLFLKQLGLGPPTGAALNLNLSGIPTGSDNLGAIGLVLSSRWESKNWSEEGYRQLVELLLARSDRNILLLGTKSDIPLAEKLAGERVCSLAGKTSMGQLVKVLSEVSIVAGPDSGPGHICSLLGKRYISLLGPTSISRTAPFGNHDIALQSAIGCAGCYLKKCPGLDSLCMRLISPVEVCSTILRNI